MTLPPSNGEKIRIGRTLPWLHFAGALLVVVLAALFSAVHSPLGQEISAGESPGFAWMRANITTSMGFGLVYLVLVCWIQLRQMRHSPDLAVTELAIPRAVSERRSATADEVFESARNAIRTLPAGERFLCFLHLMDVHNDLWKKEGGIDFGDAPRDLYDNN